MTNKVYCTKDGEYPDVGSFIRFDVGDVTSHFGYVKIDKENETYFIDNRQLSYCWYPKYIPEPIYWRYEEKASLKEQYERERGGTINT